MRPFAARDHEATAPPDRRRASRGRMRGSSLVAAAVGLGLALTGCGGATEAGGGAATSPAGATGAASGRAVDLAAVCPSRIVIQTDWNPESEHGHLYEMLGPDPVIDAANKSVSGPLYAKGAPTGVDLEIRSGGPAIGFQTVTSQMYTDRSITLGYVNTDEAIQLSAKMPTTAVFAPLDINPQMIMWDPKTYPQVKTIADLKATGATVRYFGGSAWMEYLVGKGVLSRDQLDGSYDGTPANFVAAGGKDAQQGFASAEPYIYEHEVPAWGKPVAYQLIHDAGWQIYQAAVSVRTGDLEKLSGCLAKLVPVMQQAEVDFFADPAPVEKLILSLVKEYDTGWVYSQGVADYSVKTMRDLKLAGNGPNDTIGDFDAARVAKIFDVAVPLFTRLGNTPAKGLTVDDIYTNRFIDTSIGMP